MSIFTRLSKKSSLNKRLGNMLRFITWFVGVNYTGGEMVPIRVFSPLPVRTLLSPETKRTGKPPIIAREEQ
jgi:hypothetical protein